MKGTNDNSAVNSLSAQRRQLFIWLAALVAGLLLGLWNQPSVLVVMDYLASIYTRLFRLLAAPTIALAVLTTLAQFGRQRDTRRVFLRTLTYTLLTTLAASLVGFVLYLLVQPGNLPTSFVSEQTLSATDGVPMGSYADYLLNVVPDNLIRPFLEGNVLSILLLSAACGLALSFMPHSEGRNALIQFFQGTQELLYMLIRALIWTLPLGIVAFAAQFAAQVGAGVAVSSLGRYVTVIMAGNLVQAFVVLPLFLLARGINPLRLFARMSPAVLMALFTKSSAATLPVTMQCAEERAGVRSKIARFVLPICTTINMNGCAAFILVTSLFVMQNGGIELTWPAMMGWVLISVLSAVGNAGVPMGCYFLTLSLMAGVGAPVTLMGIILPIYTLIDMVETAENVWSDSCVCAMVDGDTRLSEQEN